jgi:hypothetical protein
VRALVRAGADDDHVGDALTAGSAEQEAASRAWLHVLNRDAGTHRQVGCVLFQIIDDLVARDVSVWVVSRVQCSWEVKRPVRGDQPKAVLAATPGLGDAIPLQHHVLDAQGPQLVAHCQPRLPAADHDQGHAYRS